LIGLTKEKPSKRTIAKMSLKNYLLDHDLLFLQSKRSKSGLINRQHRQYLKANTTGGNNLPGGKNNIYQSIILRGFQTINETTKRKI